VGETRNVYRILLKENFGTLQVASRGCEYETLREYFMRIGVWMELACDSEPVLGVDFSGVDSLGFTTTWLVGY
jgi:hypothetical protein